MDLLIRCRTAGRIADNPAHRVAGGDGDEVLARLQGKIADLFGCGIEMIKGAFAEREHLDGIDIAVARRLFERRLVSGIDPCRRRGRFRLMRCRRRRLQLTWQWQRLGQLHDPHWFWWLGLRPPPAERRAVVADGRLAAASPEQAAKASSEIEGTSERRSDRVMGFLRG